MRSVNSIILYQDKPYDPKDGDAWVNYGGKLEIYYKCQWNAIMSQTDLAQLQSTIHATMTSIPTTNLHHNGLKLDQIVDTMIALFIHAGLINDERDFFDFLKAKKLADVLEVIGEEGVEDY